MSSDRALNSQHAAKAPPPLIWLIGGSDSGGGAGIQADLRTVTALGGHGCTIITAITAQNSRQLDAVFAVTPQQLMTQLDTLYADLIPATIKIGQLPDSAVALLLANWLAKHRKHSNHHTQPLVIWDPVIYASSGVMLSDLSTDSIVQLLQVVDILTPNLPELALLSQAGVVAAKVDGELAWAQLNTLRQHYSGDILLKGGHGDSADSCTDLWLAQGCSLQSISLQSIALQKIGSHGENSASTQEVPLQQASLLSAVRLPGEHNRGTGCTLASALATALAHGYTRADALTIARAYLQQSLRLSYPTGAGAGCLGAGPWPRQQRDFPHWQELTAPLPEQLYFQRLTQPIGLYPVVDDLQWLIRLLPLGVQTIQLRLKYQSSEQLERQIQSAVELCRDYHIQLFINDHWQLAIKYQAFGVHLGQEDLTSADLTAIAEHGLRLGVSTHGYAELARVLPLQPSYIALGHIFPTNTKHMPSAPQGLKRLQQYVQLCAPIPTVAIGGIDAGNIQAVVQTGVRGVAVVSAILAAPQPEKALQQLQQYCNSIPLTPGAERGEY